MLFSMFFGAGNLIFPPMLGLEAGTNFWPAIIGFLATGVLLPILTVIAVAISGSGVRDLAARAGSLFGLIFSLVVYLSIGAFYGVPRAAAIGYELGVESTFHLDGPWWRLVGTGVFFAVAFALTLWPGKVVDTVGRILTPALLILLVVLAVSAFRNLHTPMPQPAEKFADGPFVAGILQGYFTMDSIAALAFALIVVTSFSNRGVTSHRSVVRVTILASAIAGFFLLLVYLGLGYVGTAMPQDRDYSDGAALLSHAAELTMGTTGEAVFSLIVLLACLTTVIGLTASTSSFFHELVPQISYRWWALILAVVGLLLANLGLERILAVSGSIIGLIYPPAIALIAMTFVHLLRRDIEMPLAYRTAVTVAFAFSVLDLAASLGAPVGSLLDALSWIPLLSQGMGWLVPTIVLTAIAVVIDIRRAATTQAPC
ncbi:branched-chain amino acid ABC transporter [Corynebacterium falsenii DSM 44353]|nr:branched-chain amino acid ABC transporter [Corynebacterium falsenii DSM 44353]